MTLGEAKSEVLKLLDETKPKADLTGKLDRFFDIRGKVRRSNWITTPMRDGKKKLFIAMQNPQKICRRGGGRTASGVGEGKIEPGN